MGRPRPRFHATATYLGPAIIRETVTLNRERSGYEGMVTLDPCAKDETTLLEHIGGKSRCDAVDV